MKYQVSYIFGGKHVMLWSILIDRKENRIDSVRCDPHKQHLRIFVSYLRQLFWFVRWCIGVLDVVKFTLKEISNILIVI